MTIVMKWYLVSTCLVLEWNTGFLASFIADWLSMHNVVGVSWVTPRSYKILRNQTISHAASQAEMYSASAEEFATIACFLQLHDTAAEPIFIK